MVALSELRDLTNKDPIKLCRVSVHVSDFWPSNVVDFASRHAVDMTKPPGSAPWTYRVGLRLQQTTSSGTHHLNVVVFDKDASMLFHEISPTNLKEETDTCTKLKQLMFAALEKNVKVELALKSMGRGKYAVFGTQMYKDDQQLANQAGNQTAL